MKNRSAAAIIGLLAICAAPLHADGKFYVKEKVPVDLPYQRAFILFHEGRQTLVLQSKYEVTEADADTTLGWVVPVPAVPELGSLDADAAYRLFVSLSLRTRPSVAFVHDFLLAFLVPAVFLLLWWNARRVWRRSSRAWRWAAVAGCVLWAGIWVVGGLLLPALGSAGRTAGGGDGVDILQEERIGSYDVRVIQSDDAHALTAWLTENGFAFGSNDEEVFSSYIRKGWVFVTAYLRPTPEQEQDEWLVEGLAAPLVLHFPAEAPVYPLALTATAGEDTQVLLYVVAAEKMAADDRLPLRHAGRVTKDHPLPFAEMSRWVEERDPAAVGEIGWWKRQEELQQRPAGLYLCKFRGVLTPDQMREDLIFAPAADAEPYRERVLRW